MNIQNNTAVNNTSTGMIRTLNSAIGIIVPIFYFLVAVSFYLRTYDSAQIKITIVQMGGVVILLAFLIKVFEENSWRFFRDNSSYTLPVTLFFISAIVSFFISPFPWASGYNLIRRIAYFTLAIVIMKEFNDRKKIDRLIGWVLAAAFVSTFYGIVQFLDGKYFPPNPEPGLDPFIWRQAFGHRIFSTFGNPNFFGDFLLVVSPITLALYIKSRKPYLMILWLAIVFNTYVTYSKGTWVGFTAGFATFWLIFLFYFTHFKSRKLQKYVVIGIIGIIVVTGAGVWFQLTQRTDSAKFRIFTWASTWEMINTSPIIGTGIGTFSPSYPAWRRPQIFFVEGRHNTQSDSPESEYLEIWSDEGTIGFGIFLWMLSVFIIGGLKAMNSFSFKGVSGQRPDGRLYYIAGLVAALVGLLAHNAVCVSLRFVSSGVLLWLLIGLIGALLIHNPLGETFARALPQKNSLPLAARRVIQFLLVVAAIWGINIFHGIFMGDIHHNRAIFHSKRGEWSEALAQYNIVAENNYGFIMSHYFMGNVFNDRWILSRGYHPEWGDTEKDEPWTGIELGKKGRVDVERSLAKYRDVWNLAPNYVQSHHQAGIVYMKLGSHFREKGDEASAHLYWSKALEKLWKYHKIDPIFPANYQRMAWVYLQLGQIDRVKHVYKAHLSTQWLIQGPEDVLDPRKMNDENRHLYDELTERFNEEVTWVCCDFHKRENYLFFTEDWAKRRAQEYSDSYIQLANLYHLRRDFVGAERFYNRAVKRDEANIQAWRNLVVFYREQNRQKELNSLIEKYRKIFPKDFNLTQLSAQQ